MFFVSRNKDFKKKKSFLKQKFSYTKEYFIGRIQYCISLIQVIFFSVYGWLNKIIKDFHWVAVPYYLKLISYSIFYKRINIIICKIKFQIPFNGTQTLNYSWPNFYN